MSSILAVPIGILLFLGSFAALFMNEGRANIGKLAQDSIVVDASDNDDGDGEFVSLTGDTSINERVGDPDFVAPGDFITLDRVVEQYAWVEHSESRTRDKVGGGTETVTTYTYELEWTANPANSSNFEEPQGHQNPPQRIDSDDWHVDAFEIEDWTVTFDALIEAGGCLVGCSGYPGGSTMDLSDLTLIGEASKGTQSGDYLYMDGSASSPDVGDHRVSFRAWEPGDEVTVFGEADGGEIVPYEIEDGKSVLRVLNGDRDEAISSLLTEAKLAAWAFRILGFLLMWMGMQMVFAPLHAIAGILPWAKKASKFIIAAVTFPIAFVLTTITVVVSMILNNVIAIIVTCLLAAGLVGFLWSRRNKGDAPPPAAPPMGPPPGPAPGGMPGPAPAGVPPGPPPA